MENAILKWIIKMFYFWSLKRNRFHVPEPCIWLRRLQSECPRVLNSPRLFCHWRVLWNSNWLCKRLQSMCYFSLTFLLCYTIIFCSALIDGMFYSTKIPHESLALNDPTGMKKTKFQFRAWSYKYSLSVKCPCYLLQLNAVLKWLQMKIFTVGFVILTFIKELRIWLYPLSDGVCKTSDCIKSGKNENIQLSN